MSTVFDEAIQEVNDEKSAAAGEAPSTEETTSTETLAPAQVDSSPTQEAVVETPTDTVTPQDEKTTTATPTEEDTQFNLTGLETPEDLSTKHGEGWMAKAARKHLAVVKEAGGSPALRQGAQLINDVHSPSVSGVQVLNRINGFNPTRAEEIRRDVFWDTVDTRPDAVEVILRDKLPEFPDLTLDFVRTAVTNETQFAANPEAVEGDDLSTLPEALRKEIEESREMRKKYPQLEQEVSGLRQERKTEREQKQEQQQQELGHKLYQSVFSVVEERKAKLGLDDLPTDSDEVKDIKADLRDYLSNEKLEKAFFEDHPDGKRYSEEAIAYIKRLDESSAFSYRDRLAVVAEIVFGEVLKSPRIARKLANLKAVKESLSTPKNPTARPEMVAGAAAGFESTDPFDEGIKEGKRPFDIAVEIAGQRASR